MSHDVKHIRTDITVPVVIVYKLCVDQSQALLFASKAWDMNIIYWLGFLFSLLGSLPHIYIHVLQGQCKSDYGIYLHCINTACIASILLAMQTVLSVTSHHALHMIRSLKP